MADLRATFGRTVTVFAAAMALGALSMSACASRLSPRADFDQAASRLAQSADRLFSQGQPVDDMAGLARRLNLAESRVRSFDRQPFNSGLMSSAFRSNFTCGDVVCTCVGDRDCNNMFSTVCRSETTGGRCTTFGPFMWCSCHYKRT
jgi:hypothetical protein